MLARARILSKMNCLDTTRRTQVLKVLAEGMSLRGTARLTGVARMTIEKLLRDLGAACTAYQDRTLRNLTCRRVQCYEIWAFCYAKRKNVTPAIAEKHPDARPAGLLRDCRRRKAGRSTRNLAGVAAGCYALPEA